MATHSSVLAWRIPGTGEPGGLPSMGSHRVGHDWSDLAAAAAWGFPQASLMAKLVKNLPTNWGDKEMQVWSLGQKDSLEKGMATHSGILAWRIPWTEEPGGRQSTGSQESTITQWLNNWTCFVNEFWVELTFPFRAGDLNRQHESPESTLLWHRTSRTHGGGCFSGVGGLIRAPGPSRVGVSWARITFGSLKMLRFVGAVSTVQPGACCYLRRAARKMQDTWFSLDCSEQHITL